MIVYAPPTPTVAEDICVEPSHTTIHIPTGSPVSLHELTRVPDTERVTGSAEATEDRKRPNAPIRANIAKNRRLMKLSYVFALPSTRCRRPEPSLAPENDRHVCFTRSSAKFGESDKSPT